jgi:hypothetical protein
VPVEFNTARLPFVEKYLSPMFIVPTTSLSRTHSLAFATLRTIFNTFTLLSSFTAVRITRSTNLLILLPMNGFLDDVPLSETLITCTGFSLSNSINFLTLSKLLEALVSRSFKVALLEPYTVTIARNSFIVDNYTNPSFTWIIYIDGEEFLGCCI